MHSGDRLPTVGMWKHIRENTMLHPSLRELRAVRSKRDQLRGFVAVEATLFAVRTVPAQKKNRVPTTDD